MVNDRTILDALGWDDEFERAFSPHAAEGLVPARVVAEHRGAYVVRGETGDANAVVRGRVRDDALLAGGLPAVGDWVALLPQPGGGAVVAEVLRRRTHVTRKTAWREADEQVLVANVDTLFLVSDLVRDFNPRRLERYLALAHASGAEPVVVLTKLDLCGDRATITGAEELAAGVPVLAISNVSGEGLDELRRFLRPGRTVALIGSSGVGKSSLINRLAGEELFATGEVRRDGRGRHTTERRELVTLPGGALLVDTPGLRELQLWDGELDEAFLDLLALAARCRFSDCAHDREPGCAVQAAIADGELDPARLAAYRKLERELEAVEARSSRRVWAERKRRWRQRAHESRTARRFGEGDREGR
jgi:ribosome biogenesis GTPase / thiamine phosphate phosphatase